MITILKEAIGALFSSSKLADTAIDALRKAGGLDDMDPQAKANYVLDYMRVTAHQSPARRLIAMMLALFYLLTGLSWLVAASVGYYADIDSAINLAGAVRVFMSDVVLTPFNLVLSFYFVTQIAKRAGGGNV